MKFTADKTEIQKDEIVLKATQLGRDRAGNSSGLRPTLCPLQVLSAASFLPFGPITRETQASPWGEGIWLWRGSRLCFSGISDFLSPGDFHAQALSCQLVPPSPVHPDSPVQGRPSDGGGGEQDNYGVVGVWSSQGSGRDTLCLTQPHRTYV